jgi:predicted dehydrogenase
MGRVHAHAVRASGGVISRVADSSLASAERAAADLFAEGASASAEELIDADDVDLVHICTPNVSHFPLALRALRAGKHVICEKPLATTVTDAEQLASAAAEAGVVAAVPFAYRYYPTVREARRRLSDGLVGKVHLVHGAYLQDWLSSNADTNWRVDSEAGGASRAFADIGVHWCDLIEFTTGHRIERLSAQLHTVYPVRETPAGRTDVHTEDLATVMFRTDQGAAGSVVISQLSLGHKNRLSFSIEGESASLGFNQESPEQLWIGARAHNLIVLRGPDTLGPPASDYAVLPAGHPQGYQDCFNAFTGDVHAAIKGTVPDGLPTFADGLRAARLTSSVLASSANQSWVEVA